jgi:hypothetical protein
MAKKNTRIDTQLEGHVIDSDELFQQAKAWADQVRGKAKSNTSAFTKGKKGSYTYPKRSKWHQAGEVEKKLSQSLSYKVKEIGGITDSISYQFPRHGIFRAYGVGNGQSINGKQAVQSFVKRSPSDWLDDPIDQNIEKLADIAADFYGDEVTVNAYNMMIKK